MNHHRSVLLQHIPLQLDRKAELEGGDYFKYFYQRGWFFKGGNSSRDSPLLEEIRYLDLELFWSQRLDESLAISLSDILRQSLSVIVLLFLYELLMSFKSLFKGSYQPASY